MQTRFTLSQQEIPSHWYNVLADVAEPLAPPLHPGTKQPAGPGDMAAIFSEPIIEQEYKAEETAADGTLAATVAAFGSAVDKVFAAFYHDLTGLQGDANAR